MKKALLICAAAALAAGCQDDGVRRDQQRYQTVQEGSASGVTSTINAPGAIAPPLTATNADTTSDLSLPLATTGTAFGQAGSLAGTLPASQSGSMSVPYQADATGAPLPRAVRPAAPEPTRPMTSAAQPERSAPAPQPSVEAAPTPAPTDATATMAPAAPSTDTTTTSTDGAPKEKPKEKAKEEPPPPSTDTSTTTSPPPTQT